MPTGDFEERSNLGYAMAATGDFDGDGIADIAVLDPEFSRVTVYRGSRALGFELGTSTAVIQDTRVLDAGDLDGNGTDDVVTASLSGNGLAVLLGGAGGFNASSCRFQKDPSLQPEGR